MDSGVASILPIPFVRKILRLQSSFPHSPPQTQVAVHEPNPLKRTIAPTTRMRTFLAAMALTLLAITNNTGTHAKDLNTSPPPTLKYSDFVFDGKTTYCYTVTQGAAAAMMEYTTLGLEGKGDECPVQLSLEQTTTGDVGVNQPVAYKLTATVSLSSKNIFNSSVLTRVVDAKASVPMPRARLHACSSSSVCDAFRKGNRSRVSADERANFTASTVSFSPTLNFTAPDKYTVFAVLVVPGPISGNATMRFVAFTTTTAIGPNKKHGSKKNGTSSEEVEAPDTTTDAPTVTATAPVSSSSPPTSAGTTTTPKLAVTIVAGVTATASLLLVVF